jgi:hypothetical protein
MKLLNSALTTLLSLSLISTAVYCEESKHTVGLVAGIASGEYKNSSKDGDGFIQSYLFYNYQVIDNFSVEIGYNGATEYDSWDCKEDHNDNWTCSWSENNKIFNMDVDDFELDGLVAAIKGNIVISKRNSLYGKIGAQYYDFEFTGNDHYIEGDSGTGLFLEAGWQYVWDLGIGMNVGVRYQDMGDLTLTSSNVGISYSF